MGKAASYFPPDDMKTLSSLDQFLVSVGVVKKTVSGRKRWLQTTLEFYKHFYIFRLLWMQDASFKFGLYICIWRGKKNGCNATSFHALKSQSNENENIDHLE